MNEKDIAEIFNEIEMQIILSMMSSLSKHREEDFTQWQFLQLQELNIFIQDYKKKYPKIFKDVNKKIKEILKDEYKLGLKDSEKNILKNMLKTKDKPKKVLKTLKNVKGETINDKIETVLLSDKTFLNVDKKAVDKLINDSLKGIINGESAITKKLDDEYKKIIFKTQLNMQTGSMTLNQAIDTASREFLSNGLNCVEYKNGNKVNIQSYVEMSVRTSRKKAYLEGEGQARNDLGHYIVKVSQYGACSPTCLPWQGLVYIDDVYSNGKPQDMYPLLSTAISNGLFHPNCRHTLSNFYPEINHINLMDNTPQILQNYEDEQKQRYIERNIRKYKRLKAGSLTEEDKKKYKRKEDEWKTKLKNLQKTSNIRIDEWRLSNQEIKMIGG